MPASDRSDGWAAFTWDVAGMREKETWVCEWRSLELGTPGVVLIMALIVALTLAFLLASHVGAWYAVAAHGQQIVMWHCNDALPLRAYTLGL